MIGESSEDLLSQLDSIRNDENDLKNNKQRSSQQYYSSEVTIIFFSLYLHTYIMFI